jgi:hypothetical protein
VLFTVAGEHEEDFDRTLGPSTPVEEQLTLNYAPEI